MDRDSADVFVVNRQSSDATAESVAGPCAISDLIDLVEWVQTKKYPLKRVFFVVINVMTLLVAGTGFEPMTFGL